MQSRRSEQFQRFFTHKLFVLEIGPGTESASFTGEDQHAHLVIFFKGGIHCIQIIQHLKVDGIQALGSVQGNDAQTRLGLVKC